MQTPWFVGLMVEELGLRVKVKENETLAEVEDIRML